MKKYRKKKKLFNLGVISLASMAMVLPTIISCGETVNNSFQGSFIATKTKSAKEIKDQFFSINTKVQDNQFTGQNKLTGITLSNATSIGDNAFMDSPLIGIDLPKVGSVGDSAFEKADLNMLSLPSVITIGESAFVNSNLMKLLLPKVTKIGVRAFTNSKLIRLHLPLVTQISGNAFNDSKLTNLSLPKLDINLVGNNVFPSIVNESTTNVTLPSTFNNEKAKASKDKLFGKDNWDKITFSYV